MAVTGDNYLQNPAVIAMDWIGFIILFGSSFVLVYKLMYFKGPAHQPESYFFGCALLFDSRWGLIKLILTHRKVPGIKDDFCLRQPVRCAGLCTYP
jgi:hypothetical protein